MGWAGERLGHGLGGILLVVSLAGAAAPAARAQSEAPAAAPGDALAVPGEPAGPAAPETALEREVRDADALLREARFEEALERTERIRASLGPLGDEARRLRVRTEVVAATAHVALEQDDAARDCFRRALAAEPALDLDPAATSPKVLRVFRAVRSEPRGAR